MSSGFIFDGEDTGQTAQSSPPRMFGSPCNSPSSELARAKISGKMQRERFERGPVNLDEMETQTQTTEIWDGVEQFLSRPAPSFSGGGPPKLPTGLPSSTAALPTVANQPVMRKTISQIKSSGYGKKAKKNKAIDTNLLAQAMAYADQVKQEHDMEAFGGGAEGGGGGGGGQDQSPPRQRQQRQQQHQPQQQQPQQQPRKPKDAKRQKAKPPRGGQSKQQFKQEFDSIGGMGMGGAGDMGGGFGEDPPPPRQRTAPGAMVKKALQGKASTTSAGGGLSAGRERRSKSAGGAGGGSKQKKLSAKAASSEANWNASAQAGGGAGEGASQSDIDYNAMVSNFQQGTTLQLLKAQLAASQASMKKSLGALTANMKL